MKRQEFAEHLQAVLAHLYDYAYLEGHPLARVLLPPGQADGGIVSRLLMEAIEELRPRGDLPPHSLPCRKYNYLNLRYVRLENVSQVARELGIGERHSWRIQREAVEDLAAVLWPRLASAQEQGEIAEESSPLPAACPPFGGKYPGQEGAVDITATTPGQDRVGLADALDGVLATVAKLVETKGVVTSVEIPADLPPIAAERTLLRQGLLSLSTASLNSEARILRWSARALSGSVEVTLVVYDSVGPTNGRGDRRPTRSAQALLTRLQAQRSLSTGSSLLGLIGGALSVSEGPGGAVVMRVALPSARPSTVLVVDDSLKTVRLFSRYLQSRGYRVVDASSGEQALQLARQERPAAIILDVMMPKQDGWETLQNLRHHPETGHIPVVICSVIDERDLALSLGAVDLLPKPVNLEDLVQTIERCLNRSEGS